MRILGSGINARRCPRGPRGRGRPWPPWPPRKAVGALLSPQESQYPDKNHVQNSAQSELRISGNLRNGERAESENAKTERDREIDPISEGLLPLPSHGSQGPEGKPFSHLGRSSSKKNKKGGSLPLASGGTGMPPGQRSGWRSTSTILLPSTPTLSPPLCSGVTPLLPAVIST